MEEEQLTMHTVQCALHTNHIVVPCPKDRQPPTYHFDRMGLKEETSREEGNMYRPDGTLPSRPPDLGR